MKKRCVCYARVSTDKTEQETSIESQVAFFKQYVNSNPQLELVDTFIDHGISGTDVKNRTEFLNMLSKVGVVYKSHKHFEAERVEGKLPYDVILVKDCSRFSRNLRQCLEIIECLKNNGVAVYFITENIFSDRASDLMMLQLLGTFSENFSRSLSEKIRLGHEMASKNSDRIHTTGKLYGYDYINGELRINEEEAKVVRLIYKLYTEDLKGLRALGNILYEQGYRTRNNERFCKNSILSILTNEKYYGCSNRGKYYIKGAFSNNGKTAHIKENYMDYAKMSDKIEPIIDKATFDLAQSILKTRQNRIGVNPGWSKYAGLIQCAKCGSRYNSNSDRSRKYYVCNGKRKYGVSYCSNKNISLLKLDSLLTSKYIVSCLESIKLLNKTRLNRRIQELEQSKDKCIADEVQSLKIDLNELNIKLERLVDLYMNGDLDLNIYKGRQSKLNEEINSLKASIEAKSKGNDTIDLEIQELKQSIANVNTLEVKEHYTDEEIILMINKITVEDNYLYIKLNINGSIVDVPEPLEFT